MVYKLNNLNKGMENYYTDSRVILALESSNGLMDILTFVKEIDFEIKDNLGFDVLWDSMVGPLCGAQSRFAGLWEDDAATLLHRY